MTLDESDEELESHIKLLMSRLSSSPASEERINITQKLKELALKHQSELGMLALPGLVERVCEDTDPEVVQELVSKHLQASRRFPPSASWHWPPDLRIP